MKFKIKNRWSGDLQFIAEIEADDDTAFSTKIRLAVEWARKFKANLRGADLYGADLRGADLYGADLYGADLRWVDLRGADLYGADLYGADLRDANLRGVDLRGADLRDANLRGVDLRGADLDFSSGITFSCKGVKYKGDDRLAAQLLYHLTRGDWSLASGGVQEAIEHIKNMAVSDLFCEYRNDVKKLEE